MKKASLGQLLFYDKILSGNRNISCGTCHNHKFGGSDGLSLGIGEGGIGVGPKRTPGIKNSKIKKRIPRNAPGLWNLGAKEIKTVQHDGSINIANTYENGFNTPAEEWLPTGLDNLIAVQALFPMTKQFEMAGNPNENDLSRITHKRIDYVWPIISNRIRSIPDYEKLFVSAFKEINRSSDININHIVNAISAFIILEWTSINSPFDDYLKGNKEALSKNQIEGMNLFYGKANCSSCHSGPLLTDHKFYSIGLPQFGPGRTRRFDPYTRDVGRMGETDSLEDAYKFRTPSLRNVLLTAPYGHNGAYPDLKGIIKHHLNPHEMLENWNPKMAKLTPANWLHDIDFVVLKDKWEKKRLIKSINIDPIHLSEKEIDTIIDFLKSLTGKRKNDRPLGQPLRVPSGIEVDK